MAWVFGTVAVVAFMVWVIRAIFRHENAEIASRELEQSMDRKNLDQVRSLLLVRGHLLRKDVRESAQVWLLERENKS